MGIFIFFFVAAIFNEFFKSASFSVSSPADLLRPSYASRSPSAPEVRSTLEPCISTPTVHELRKLSVNLSSPVKSQLRVHRPSSAARNAEMAEIENPEKRLSLRPKSTSDLTFNAEEED
ncbi:unnamed protein product [Oikopleura dioica]|uniref:Uncharacterized protein n=1 Tax=Oikopleura dioica TaxID=34765 RepID=E4YYV6_OIKDI|nr:unnamed protein product [Oikopleura dioica]